MNKLGRPRSQSCDLHSSDTNNNSRQLQRGFTLTLRSDAMLVGKREEVVRLLLVGEESVGKTGELVTQNSELP